MTAEAWCEKFDMPAAMCAHCRGITDQPPPPAGGSPGPWITAEYHGRCSVGEEHIAPGDWIRSDGEGGWLCGQCGVGQ